MALVLNGSNDTITGLQINSANIVDGSIVNADINASAAIASTKLSGITAGITMADQWRWTTQFTQTNTHNRLATTSDWERPDSKGGIASNPLGTGMSQSGGIFTFPSTGYYFVMFTAAAKVDNDSCELFATIRACDDGSSFDNVSEYLSTIQNQCTPNYNTANCNYLFRVTNTSNIKAQFQVQNSGLSVTWMGETNKNRIAATFLKVGDI